MPIYGIDKYPDDDIFKDCRQHKCRRGPLVTDFVSGEVACKSCGLVLIERAESTEQERAPYDVTTYMARSRTGAGFSLAAQDKGLYTNIGSQNIDASGRPLSGAMKNSIERLRRWDRHSKSRRSSRSLGSALTIFDSARTKISIPDSVIEEAAYIYRKALAARMTRGRSASSFAGAALYAACRECDIPRTLKDVASATNLQKKAVSRSYRMLVNSFGLRLRPFDSTEFITRISNEVGITERTGRDALGLVARITESGTSAGKNPMSVAAAALFLSCVKNGEKKSQVDIAHAAGITTVTIRNRIHGLRKELGLGVEGWH